MTVVLLYAIIDHGRTLRSERALHGLPKTACAVLRIDAAALADAGHEFDRYLRAQPENVSVPAEALDLFLTEQLDACVAASIEA